MSKKLSEWKGPWPVVIEIGGLPAGIEGLMTGPDPDHGICYNFRHNKWCEWITTGDEIVLDWFDDCSLNNEHATTVNSKIQGISEPECRCDIGYKEHDTNCKWLAWRRGDA